MAQPPPAPVRLWDAPVRRATADAEVTSSLLALEAKGLISVHPTSAIAGDLLRIGLNDLAPTYYTTLADRYAGITAADVRRAAQTYFHPDNLVEARTGPKT